MAHKWQQWQRGISVLLLCHRRADGSQRGRALSPWGYERKHAVLHKAGDYENAINAFEAMLLKMSELSDLEIRGEGVDIMLKFI